MLPHRWNDVADTLYSRIAGGQDTPVVLPHFPAQVGSAVYRESQEGRSPQRRAAHYIAASMRPPGAAPPDLYGRCLETGVCPGLHLRFRYDLVYLTLAEMLGAEFWTFDAGLCRTV